MSTINEAHDPSVGVRRRHLPSFAGEEVTTRFLNALIPFVRIAGRAHVGEGCLQLLGDIPAFGRRQEAADHYAIAARGQH